MDQSISAVLGAIVFAAFTLGLAESIGSIPFFIIVLGVVSIMGYSVYEVVREQLFSGKSDNSTK